MLVLCFKIRLFLPRAPDKLMPEEAHAAASGFTPKALELAVDFFGLQRVLFGSDAALDFQNGQVFICETLHSIDAMNALPETRAAILSKIPREF